jgi:HSP20 family molecular chaperone IbpA
VQSASLEDGILKVFLKNEIPERDKPRKIEIGTSAPDVQLLVE